MSPSTNRLRVASAVAGCVLASAAALASAAPRQSHAASDSAVRGRGTSIAVGHLTEPSSAPPAALARAYLGANLGEERSYRLETERRSRRGALVVLQETYRGVDVVGSRAAVRLDRAGRVRWSAIAAPRVSADLAVEPRVDARTALALAFGDEATAGVDETRHAQLVVFAHPALPTPRLAWYLRFADSTSAASYRVYVDAADGTVLSRENLARRATKHRARIYEVNPVQDPETSEAVFYDLPVYAETLEDYEVRVVNCVDERACHTLSTVAGVRDVHYCELVPTAFAGEAGDFLHIVPPGDDTAAEDAFAEVQAYHHVKTALDAFRGWAGTSSFRLDNDLTVIVNLRSPDLTSQVSACEGGRVQTGSRLQPEDNAYFWPAGDLGPVEVGDRLVFGQGTFVDWAYDGEVVYHEVAHAVMHTATPLAWVVLDEHGFDPGPGAMHEGFSDYFAATITGNAELCWYAGTDENGPAPLGSLLDEVSCTEVLVGEEHEESKPWSGALWAIRRSLRSQAKRDMFDAALFNVISGLGQFDGLEVGYQLVLAELEVAAEEFIDLNGLTAAEAASLREIVAKAPEKFAERGLPSCNGRVLEIAPGEDKAELYSKGPTTWSSPAALGQALPASMQFALDVPIDTDAIQIRVDYSYPLDDEIKAPGMPAAPELLLLVEPEEPIRWSWTLPYGEHSADYQAAVELASDEDGSMVGVVRGAFPAGRYYLQLANRGADWGLEGIRFWVAERDGSFGDGKTDSAGGSLEEGAGCRVGSGSPTGGGLVLVLLATGALCRRPRGRAVWG